VTPAGHDEGPDREAAGRIPPYLSARLPTGPPAEPEQRPDHAAPHAHLRPFVMTSGRVQGAPNIGLETQVTARLPGEPPTQLPPEMRAIIALCRRPASVAEISSRVGLHLGVTKILVGDLQAAGYLDVHLLDSTIPHQPETILRVIHGLRAIS
jgi:hypothetical protein